MKKFFTLSLMAMVAIVAMAQTYPERIYLCGPAGPGWATKTWPMYTNLDSNGMPNGTYEWVGDLAEGQIKFLYGNDWEPAYVAAVDGEALSAGTHTMATRLSGADADNKWAAAAGRYKLEINVATMTLTVSDGTGLNSKNGDSQFLYMIGDGCSTGWSLDDAKTLTNNGSNIFEGDYTLTTSGEMKLLCQRDWGLHYGPVTNGEALTGVGTYTLARHEDGDYKFAVSLTQDTTFHFVVNLTTCTMVVSNINPTGLDNITNETANKQVINGQMVIVKDGIRYNVLGAKL